MDLISCENSNEYVASVSACTMAESNVTYVAEYLAEWCGMSLSSSRR